MKKEELATTLKIQMIMEGIEGEICKRINSQLIYKIFNKIFYFATRSS